MHVVSELEQTAHVKRRRREIQCDRQMDLSLPVNQISGGGDAAVACLAYFPPFISQFILLGRLEVRYMKGVQPRLACHRKTAKKWLHSSSKRGWVESQHAKVKNGPLAPLFHLYTLHLHSPRGPISLVCGFFFFPFRLVKFRPSRCFCCVHS